MSDFKMTARGYRDGLKAAQESRLDLLPEDSEELAEALYEAAWNEHGDDFDGIDHADACSYIAGFVAAALLELQYRRS